MRILVTADWHIRGERPICRLDEDWIGSQRKTIQEIRDIFAKLKCEQMWILGDLFDAPRCSTEAVNMLIEELLKFPKDSVKVLCGNHDLKDHNYENLSQCSIGTIKQLFGDIPNTVDGMKVSARPFGLDEDSDADMVCTHQLTFPNDEARPFPGIGVTADELLARWPQAKFILTGDYHHGFIYKTVPDIIQNDEEHARFVINPGCINIQKADELDYEPLVMFMDTVDMKIQPIHLKTQSENCTRDHIEERESREEMLSSVVETIQGGSDVTLDFDANLEAQVNRTSPAIIGEYSIMRQTINGEK